MPPKGWKKPVTKKKIPKLDLGNITAKDLKEVRCAARDSSRLSGDRKVDHAKCLNLRLKGVSVADLAAMFHVTPQAVKQVLSKYIKSSRELKVYKENKADLIADLSRQVLESIKPGEGPQQSNLQKATTFGILYDKEYKERDKDKMKVSMVSVHTQISNNIQKINQEIMILEGPIMASAEPEQNGLRSTDLTDDDISMLEAEIIQEEG